MYSFKHALTQDVVYGGLLDRRRRQYHTAAARGIEELHAGAPRRGGGAARLPLRQRRREREGRRLRHSRRREGAAPLGQHRGAGLLRGRPQAPPDPAGHRGEPAPSHRRGGQAGGADVRARASRPARQGPGGHPPADRARRSGPPRGLVLLGGIPPQPHRRSPRGSDRLLPGGDRPRRPRRPRRHARLRARAASRRCTSSWGSCARRRRWASAPSPSSRRSATCGGRAGRSGFSARRATRSGEWERGFGYCRRALEHGQAVNDLRLKIVGWYRTGSTHMLRGDADAAVRCFDEALKLSPIPFDATLARAFKGFALAKAGQVEEGIALLKDALAWLEQSQIPYTSSYVSVFLAESYLRAGERGLARAVAEPLLETNQKLGYRHLEGWTERVLGECAGAGDTTGGGASSGARGGDPRSGGSSKRAREDARGPGGAAGRGWRPRNGAAASRPGARDLRWARDARRA